MDGVSPRAYLPLVSAIALVLLVVACDPIASMSGTVKRADGVPVSDATVSISCKSLDGWGMSATTNAQGEFSASKIGCIDKNCGIDVAVEGEPTRQFPSADYCASDCGVPCPRTIRADLTIPAAL